MIQKIRKIDPLLSNLIDTCFDAAGATFNLTRYDILNGGRTYMEFMSRLFIANELFKFTRNKTLVGKILNKDHSTIVYYVNSFDDLINYDKTASLYYKIFKSNLYDVVSEMLESK